MPTIRLPGVLPAFAWLRHAGEFADQRPICFEEGELHLAFRLLLEVVIGDRAAGRVLANTDARADTSGSYAGAVGFARLEQVCIGARNLIVQLSERGDIIEDPERATVGTEHQIVILDFHVADRNDRQVELQRTPLLTAVERDVDPELAARVEQSGLDRILANDPDVVICRYSPHHSLPARTVVRRPEYVGREVVEFVAIHRQVRRSRVMRRCLDDADQPPVRHVLGRHVFPTVSLVSRDVDQSIVGAGPDHPTVQSRRCE